jgi:hypothetical protein
VTSRLRSATDPDGRFAAEAPAVLEFASRQALDQRLEERSGRGSTWTRFREIPASLLGVHRRLT